MIYIGLYCKEQQLSILADYLQLVTTAIKRFVICSPQIVSVKSFPNWGLVDQELRSYFRNNFRKSRGAMTSAQVTDVNLFLKQSCIESRSLKVNIKRSRTSTSMNILVQLDTFKTKLQILLKLSFIKPVKVRKLDLELQFLTCRMHARTIFVFVKQELHRIVFGSRQYQNEY